MTLSMEDTVAVRTHGPSSGPTVVYMPGLHGDWTLIGRFREALKGQVRFAEITYPRTLTWSLDDYALGVIRALAAANISSGWLLAESFSSQVAWRMVGSEHFTAQGLILAGGFVRYPMLWGVRLMERLLGPGSFNIVTRVLFGYAKVARLRHRHSPETLQAFADFMARRNPLDLQAARHRLHLLAGSDPCQVARNTSVPVYGLTGLFDPIVPWWWVRSWLKQNCQALREFRVIARCDHNVLSNAAETAGQLVTQWVGNQSNESGN